MVRTCITVGVPGACRDEEQPPVHVKKWDQHSEGIGVRPGNYEQCCRWPDGFALLKVVYDRGTITFKTHRGIWMLTSLSNSNHILILNLYIW
jgi:hypothetical protein